MHWNRLIIQNWLIERKSTKSLIFKKALKKQSYTSILEEIHPFEYAANEIRTRWTTKFCQGQGYNINYLTTWQVPSNSRRQKGDDFEIGEEQYMLMKKLKVLQQIFSEYRNKSDKGSKATQMVYKDLKLAKTASK